MDYCKYTIYKIYNIYNIVNNSGIVNSITAARYFTPGGPAS